MGTEPCAAPVAPCARASPGGTSSWFSLHLALWLPPGCCEPCSSCTQRGTSRPLSSAELQAAPGLTNPLAGLWPGHCICDAFLSVQGGLKTLSEDQGSDWPLAGVLQGSSCHPALSSGSELVPAEAPASSYSLARAAGKHP